ncbi:MAG: TetR/AcrR family transcriptional regulator [Sodalis sp. (in: enterobacteria)]|uniref:TetR/AcrR family transcriptional regulator n=1 Tax=Sodalis sp. (in: enterobacteria) TaxID=1898979 RepID=UPI003F328EFD
MSTLTEQKRTDILNAASAVFLEHGYQRASMNEVAKRAGGPKATLYNYYDSKESLFDAVVRAYGTLFLIRAAKELSSAEQEKLTLVEKLQRFGENMLGEMTSDWKAMQLYRMVAC